jgi:molybdopterin-guanine dinucleotide biosynthesis protein A
MRRELLDGLARFVAQGGRKLDLWSGRQRRVLVAFDDAQAFANANTPGELAELERSAPHDD